MKKKESTNTFTYEIPILYQSMMVFTVEAKTLQGAVNMAVEEFLHIPHNYICDSIELDDILEEWYPEEEYNLDTALNCLET